MEAIKGQMWARLSMQTISSVNCRIPVLTVHALPQRRASQVKTSKIAFTRQSAYTQTPYWTVISGDGAVYIAFWVSFPHSFTRFLCLSLHSWSCHPDQPAIRVIPRRCPISSICSDGLFSKNDQASQDRLSAPPYCSGLLI